MIEDLHCRRRYPVGAEPLNDGVHFRVWAPICRSVEVVFPDEQQAPLRLEPEADGYFSGFLQNAGAGLRYKFRLDQKESYPDPASRFQPDGPHGFSQVVDGGDLQWTDDDWRGVPAHGQVLYEMHIGTFTQQGTWNAATDQLQSLKDLGVTCLEIMPVSEFPGEFGWGYDGTYLFAPFHHYGSPDDFRRFVDRAHALEMGVILDLVYNHFGPDGNYTMKFSDRYFSPIHNTDWGDAINFDGEGCQPVREFFLANAIYWIQEFHLDGFRFDATQAIVDASSKHILREITERARAAAGKRSIYLVNENEPQDGRLVRPPESGGYGMDGMWNDDFHHAAMVALTGKREAYYTDYAGTPAELIACAKFGYLYQGQRYAWQKKRRGSPALDLAPTAFVHFLQNHDQIANSGRAWRVSDLTSPGELRALTAFFLLMPQTPMLFQGQEFAASSPFFYFANHNSDLGKLICAGRAKEISQFPSAATPQLQAVLQDPCSREAFEKSKLDHAQRDKPGHHEMYLLHQDLLRLRRSESAIARVRDRRDFDAAVIGPGAFLLRFFDAGRDDRLLLVNLGADLPMHVAPEPLLAPPAERRWDMVLCSEDPKYGGTGAAALETEDEGWWLPGRCAALLKPGAIETARVKTRIVHHGSAQAPIPKPECSTPRRAG